MRALLIGAALAAVAGGVKLRTDPNPAAEDCNEAKAKFNGDITRAREVGTAAGKATAAADRATSAAETATKAADRAAAFKAKIPEMTLSADSKTKHEEKIGEHETTLRDLATDATTKAGDLQATAQPLHDNLANPDQVPEGTVADTKIEAHETQTATTQALDAAKAANKAVEETKAKLEEKAKKNMQDLKNEVESAKKFWDELDTRLRESEKAIADGTTVSGWTSDFQTLDPGSELSERAEKFRDEDEKQFAKDQTRLAGQQLEALQAAEAKAKAAEGELTTALDAATADDIADVPAAHAELKAKFEAAKKAHENHVKVLEGATAQFAKARAAQEAVPEEVNLVENGEVVALEKPTNPELLALNQ